MCFWKVVYVFPHSFLLQLLFFLFIPTLAASILISLHTLHLHSFLFSMDYNSSSWINTSLDLNISLHEQLIINPKNEVENNLFSLGMMTKSSTKLDEYSSRYGLVEEVKRVSEENKKLTGRLTEMCENYNTLMEYITKKRKSHSTSSDEHSCMKLPITTDLEQTSNIHKTKVSRLYFKTQPSDSSLVVKDGYQWRKYGQKVTRDNPSPRAYFKCSFAPTCTVKKKVQRAVDDPSLVVATYEGEHNHPQMDPTINHNSSRNKNDSSSSSKNIMMKNSKIEQVPHKFLVEEMATSLTTDLNFRAALAAAISGKVLNHN